MRQSSPMPALAIVLLTTGLIHGSGQQPANSIHVLRISSGPAGAEANGVFRLTSERSIFNRTDDREVIVFFEWDGVAGPHRLVAQWRSPDSAVTSNSAVDYVAQAPRFGAYWSLPLTPSMSLGTWSIEATVDGVPAGRLTFEVTDNRVASSPAKPALTQAALYDLLKRRVVIMQRLSKAGQTLPPAAGFSPSSGFIYTAMSTLDNADDIRASQGSATPLTSAVAWNRQQQWAVLPGGPSVDVQPVAAAGATHVGSRCFSVDNVLSTGLMLSECSITGQNARGAATLIATFVSGRGTPGAPVVNEFGELIGLVADTGRTGERSIAYTVGASGAAVPIVPIGVITFDATTPPVALADLRARGITIPGTVGDEHVMTAGFGRVDAKKKLVSTEHHEEFSVRDPGFAVFVVWQPKQRLRGQMIVRLFDGENRAIAESKPMKVDIQKNQSSTSSWTLPMLPAPGTYRADVFLDNTPMWRGFVRITS